MKMMRYVTVVWLPLTLALSLIACKKEPRVESHHTGTQAKETERSKEKIQYSMKADGRLWKLATEDTQEQMKITQYILENEQPENATELFSVTEMTDINITPAEYFSQFITQLQKRYANAKVESKVSVQKINSLLGEWWINGNSPDNTQHEWIHIIKKGNEIAVLRYSTIHTEDLEHARKIWEAILTEAKFE